MRVAKGPHFGLLECACALHFEFHEAVLTYVKNRTRCSLGRMKNDLFTQDHYRVLGVARDANHGTIREAYLRLVKKHHPDISKGAESEEKFKAIASAWEASHRSAGGESMMLSGGRGC